MSGEDDREAEADALWEKIGLEPPPKQSEESRELNRRAMSFLSSSEDRTVNFISAGGETVQLQKMPTLLEAKAQKADAAWVIRKILESR